jgi:molybdenum cofactor biosynthesis enzyme MoaA
MSPKSCIHTYSGISIARLNGTIQPCCKYQTSKDTPTIFDVDSLNDIHSSKYYKNLQQQLDSGIFPPGCIQCQTDEAVGITSTRQHTEQVIFDNAERFKKNNIQDLEIGLDFTCNMMCRMCGASASSKWGQAKTVQALFKKHELPYDSADNLKKYRNYQSQFFKIFENTNLSEVIHIRLEGGEPFYSKNINWFIDKLDQEVKNKNNLVLSIFTNCSIFPSTDLLEKLKKFHLNITFSLDAIGELAETIRWGASWTSIETNVQLWKSFADDNKNVQLSTSTTVSLLNVNAIDDLIEFCNSNSIKMFINHLTMPEYLSIYQLPVEVRKQWLNGNDRFNELLLADIKTPQQFDKFLKSVEILDQYQQKSFALNNSEIYNLIVELNKFERQRRVTDGQ